jgi:hypothetical protein
MTTNITLIQKSFFPLKYWGASEKFKAALKFYLINLLASPVKTMSRRNSPNSIKSLDELSSLDEIVIDKRLGKRSHAKKSRRNRHYEKQFIRNTLQKQ